MTRPYAGPRIEARLNRPTPIELESAEPLTTKSLLKQGYLQDVLLAICGRGFGGPSQEGRSERVSLGLRQTESSSGKSTLLELLICAAVVRPLKP